MRIWACWICATLVAGQLVAQIGGTGRDGVFHPTKRTTLDTSKNGGIFHFTTIRIPKGVVVNVRGPNAAVLHSQGPVAIDGELRADGELCKWGFCNVAPGAGGYAGGAGGVNLGNFWMGRDGLGPGGGKGALTDFRNPPPYGIGGGGGHATPGRAGTAGGGASYGSAYPFDPRGGSGGGGGWWPKRTYQNSGTGGGGVLVVLADGEIQVTGTVSARGGDYWFFSNSIPYKALAGCGAGGSILLRSMRRVRITKTGSVLATGGSGIELHSKTRQQRGAGGDGFLRVDTYGRPPEVEGTVRPKALLMELPELRVSIPPKVARRFGLSSASVPGDIVAVFFSWNTSKLPLPPLGVLYLALDATFIYGGAILIPNTGVDPVGNLVLSVHDDPSLIGRRINAQGVNLITRAAQLRLTNLASAVFVR